MIDMLEITATDYYKALEAWREEESASHVAYVTKLSRKLAKELIEVGIPHLGLAPIDKKNDKKATSKKKKKAAKKKAAKKKAPPPKKESAPTQSNATNVPEKSGKLVDALPTESSSTAIVSTNAESMPTEESLVKANMRTAMNMATIIEHATDRLLDGIDTHEIELPDKITLKSLKDLTAAIEKSNAAIERAIKMERTSKGQGEAMDEQTKMLMVLINAMSSKDVGYVLDNNGAVPQNIVQTVTAEVVDTEGS